MLFFEKHLFGEERDEPLLCIFGVFLVIRLIFEGLNYMPETVVVATDERASLLQPPYRFLHQSFVAGTWWTRERGDAEILI